MCVSGQIGLRDGALVDGFEAQFSQVLENLGSLLDANGLRVEQIAKATVFLVDMGDYPQMNAQYLAFLGEHRPARSAVAVAALPLDAVVELEAWVHDPA